MHVFWAFYGGQCLSVNDWSTVFVITTTRTYKVLLKCSYIVHVHVFVHYWCWNSCRVVWAYTLYNGCSVVKQFKPQCQWLMCSLSLSLSLSLWFPHIQCAHTHTPFSKEEKKLASSWLLWDQRWKEGTCTYVVYIQYHSTNIHVDTCTHTLYILFICGWLCIILCTNVGNSVWYSGVCEQVERKKVS